MALNVGGGGGCDARDLEYTGDGNTFSLGKKVFSAIHSEFKGSNFCKSLLSTFNFMLSVSVKINCPFFFLK